MVGEISKIRDYAIIGDSRSAALVSKRGSIDWLCWPRFDSPSVFGAIIDPNVGGYWSVRPTNDFQVSRRYIDKTNVLETTFTKGSARIVLIDFMAVTSEDTKHGLLWPDHELIRQIRCEHGEAELVVEFNPRLNYGRIVPQMKKAGKFASRIEWQGDVFTLRSDVDLDCFKQSSLAAAFVLKAGESVAFCRHCIRAWRTSNMARRSSASSNRRDSSDCITDGERRSQFCSPTLSSARSSAHFTS